MQQATVNLFADMLRAAGDAADRAPGSRLDGHDRTDLGHDARRPAIVTAGTPVTVSGTAADTGGGRVGGVEVSVDGGATWHPATGRESWSYTWTPTVSGQVAVRSRAVDDSGNLEGADTGGGGQPGPPPGRSPAAGRRRRTT